VNVEEKGNQDGSLRDARHSWGVVTYSVCRKRW